MKFKFFKPKKSNKEPVKITYKEMESVFKNQGFEEFKIEFPNRFLPVNLSWEVFFNDEKAIVKDSKGMGIIHFLLKQYSKGNKKPISLDELELFVLNPDSSSQEPIPKDSVIDSNYRFELLDRKAIRNIFSRLESLKADLEDTSLTEDERDSRLEEINKIENLIASDTFQGRSKAYSEQESLQESTRKNIKDAIKGIMAVHPILGTHLDKSIFWRSGWIYSPETNEKWKF